MKLLIHGGGIAAGHGVTKGYVEIVREQFLPKGIEVLNRSRFKETTFDGIGAFHQDIGFFRPNILLFHLGIDNAFSSVYRSEFQENIVQMIRMARENHNDLL